MTMMKISGKSKIYLRYLRYLKLFYLTKPWFMVLIWSLINEFSMIIHGLGLKANTSSCNKIPYETTSKLLLNLFK